MSFFEIHDPAFGRFVMGNAPVKRLATGFDWVEGPVWFGDAGCLLFSDIPNNRILRWTRRRADHLPRSPPTMPTATPATGRGGWSAANTAPGA